MKKKRSLKPKLTIPSPMLLLFIVSILSIFQRLLSGFILAVDVTNFYILNFSNDTFDFNSCYIYGNKD
ncbi:hypothetical protein PM10SUCC1_23310 [Propionigenium maris DSM 9537]|uniref:Uncharacterized protein n=1 Tax=Propionigenium maris DSM 9537 TaxID=1123000 RepID=A0A9W6GNI8_9FUSO|nr:hypothetical protein [Propionigenium maris]GLI56817.1 hypothetical protein PM10SUCC1_23310 [Propionigenium maris DSM 9537]